MKINTKFNIDQKVYIKQLKIWGTVLSFTYSSRLEYYIRFFDKFEPKNIYFLEDELGVDENNEKIGFQ